MENPDPSRSLPSRIASLVHGHFDGLPSRSKPTVRSDGTKEWIPMSGIVIVKGENTPSEKLTCVAVTSGAKCLSASQVPNGKGLVLHDWHAEILALRAFNYWLLSESRSVLANERHQGDPSDENTEPSISTSSPYIRRRQRPQHPNEHPSPPFELQPDITIYMYCTCAPCGDASMELCMAAQDDPTPWEVKSPRNKDTMNPTDSHNHEQDQEPKLLDGRGYFSRLGIVRRKPARADADATMSKSCSDKLSLRQISSLLSFETSLLVAPTESAYLAGVILPEREISDVACLRAFSDQGRLKELKGRSWPLGGCDDAESNMYGYRFRPFQVLSIPDGQYDSLWKFGKTQAGSSDEVEVQEKCKPATVSALWVAAPSVSSPGLSPVVDTSVKSLPVLRGSKTGVYENIISGVKQGNKASAPQARGASALSRAKLWGIWREIVRISYPETVDEEGNANNPEENLEKLAAPTAIVEAATYREFKKAPVTEMAAIAARKSAIQEAKRVLGGWVANVDDADWGLDVLVDPKKRKR
ncbi:putative tRNA-specific adenosine deaminase [Aspergillus steynii IBT 23096]|uniref:Putative tRNA-specific adenosine deaminase n=1 Tax=Aspergillus steynii IBT 23096 TaxID=1392250 RepID=A0A2I2G1R3_9EURO|nr:putative tRNA-specific adenosine deaminase [Aspergillus steynii IBT 23096]PLB46803.1 putative tRNA-specific adenosine deaminase [Aspergillus steynii IBT 23096]